LPDRGVPMAINAFQSASKTYFNKGKITTEGKVAEHQKVVLKSEYAIELNPGFETIEGATFEASIEALTTPKLSQKVSRISSTLTLNLSPNPVFDNLVLNIQSETEGTADIDICNTQGVIIMTKSAKLYKGTQQLAVDCNTMPNGLYVALININGSKKGEKFIVNRH
jgi:uncharacterized membrane protein